MCPALGIKRWLRSSCCGSAAQGPYVLPVRFWIPGITQWVKCLVLPQAVADVAQIWYWHGCIVGWQVQLWFHFWPWEPLYAMGEALRKKKMMVDVKFSMIYIVRSKMKFFLRSRLGHSRMLREPFLMDWAGLSCGLSRQHWLVSPLCARATAEDEEAGRQLFLFRRSYWQKRHKYLLNNWSQEPEH